MTVVSDSFVYCVNIVSQNFYCIQVLLHENKRKSKNENIMQFFDESHLLLLQILVIIVH